MMLTELFERFTPYEWIVSNQKGGYALGSAFLANLRKYHGLLIAGYEKGKRIHLVSSAEEQVFFPSGLSYFLDTNFYRDTLFPEGFKLIKAFFFRPFPQFYFFCPESRDFFLKKEIKMHPLKNLVVISYENISSYPFRIIIRPKFSFRDHHRVTNKTEWEKEFVEVEVEDKTGMVVKGSFSIFVYLSNGSLTREELFYHQVFYPIEEIRGYEATEDLYAPFKIEVELKTKDCFKILFSDEPIKDLEKVLTEVERRYQGLPVLIPNKKESFSRNEYLRILKKMVEDFLLEDDIIAGFPWFYCWGRDTFIGLPAVFYLDGGKEKALKIFKNYAKRMVNGLIPNVIGDEQETNYNSVDASLWFGLRIFQFLETFPEVLNSLEGEILLLAVKEVIKNFCTNPDLPFLLDHKDRFIEIFPQTNKALTWMDVVLDGVPVTPRYGKPIEIQGLWYNLLKFAEKHLEKSFLENFRVSELISLQEKNFIRFFDGNAWADRLFNDEPVFEIRPNYIIALSLPFDITDKPSLLKGVELAKQELVTPFGLRSLSPKDPSFRRKYFGTQRMRDLAYHNGTVWVWLIYPYAEVLKKAYKEDKEGLKRELEGLVRVFREGICRGKMGSIPELYDGENPKHPKGAHAQFWSVAAVFLVEQMIEGLKV